LFLADADCHRRNCQRRFCSASFILRLVHQHQLKNVQFYLVGTYLHYSGPPCSLDYVGHYKKATDRSID